VIMNLTIPKSDYNSIYSMQSPVSISGLDTVFFRLDTTNWGAPTSATYSVKNLLSDEEVASGACSVTGTYEVTTPLVSVLERMIYTLVITLVIGTEIRTVITDLVTV